MKISYYPAKTDDHNHSGNEDIMVSVCYVISPNHVVKGSCDFMGGSPSL